MDWARLADFIDRRDPGFSQRIRGASPAAIEALECLHPIRLPRAYRGFLSFMGADTGEFALDEVRSLQIDHIIEWFDYPDERFMLFAAQIDEVDDLSDLGDEYLVLTQGDRRDPPVSRLYFETYYGRLVSDIEEFEIHTRFSEHVQVCAYERYEVVCYLHHARLSLTRRARRDALIHALEGIGLEAALPGGPGLWVGCEGERVAARLISDRRGHELWIDGRGEAEVEGAIAAIRAAGARLR